MIEIKNLVKRYGDLVALDHLNLEIHEGEVFGLLGPNGSGKTTAINCLLSLLKFDKGEIRVMGKPMSPAAYDLKQQIGVVPQNMAVFDELTVYENIDYFCGLYIKDKQKRRQLVEEAIAFTGLEDFRKMRPKKLSGGLQRRLNIAAGIAHKPRLLIMDEPTVAVDPQSRNRILEGITQLNQQGTTVIYTSHYMEEVEQICSRIAIMDHGRVIAQGTKEELKAMIKTGGVIEVTGAYLEKNQLEAVEALPAVLEAACNQDVLTLKCSDDKEGLLQMLGFLQQNQIPYGGILSQQPTLNDVFLEITGKQLRD